MAYAAWLPAGTTLAVNTGTGLANINGIHGGLQLVTGTKPSIDVTALSDTTPQSLVGMTPPHTVTGTLYWDPADTTQTFLYNSYANASGPLQVFAMNCTDGGNCNVNFNARVMQFGPISFEQGAGAKAGFQLLVNGNFTITP
jgi:hypothetical protein